VIRTAVAAASAALLLLVVKRPQFYTTRKLSNKGTKWAITHLLKDERTIYIMIFLIKYKFCFSFQFP